MSRSNRKSGPHVVVLAYDGLCTFEFGICVEVFALERPEITEPWYRFQVTAMEEGPLTAMGGVQVLAPYDLNALVKADLILIPGWRGAATPVPDPLIKTLRKAHDNGARIATICSGVFVLAAAGLLAGKRATTHWRYADLLAEKYPDIEVTPDVLYIDEGAVLTSAGSAAGLDLCLHIIRQDYGAEIANLVARRLVLPAHRDGGQAQFIQRPVGRDRGGNITPLLDKVRRELDRSWTIDKMAQEAGLSPRTLQRRLKAATGESPQIWLTRERLAYARELLETSEIKIDQVAERAGFGSGESFRLHFRRNFGISPKGYRNGFQTVENN
jgi:AraC family transcriptional activator FtrA